MVSFPVLRQTGYDVQPYTRAKDGGASSRDKLRGLSESHMIPYLRTILRGECLGSKTMLLKLSPGINISSGIGGKVKKFKRGKQRTNGPQRLPLNWQRLFSYSQAADIRFSAKMDIVKRGCICLKEKKNPQIKNNKIYLFKNKKSPQQYGLKSQYLLGFLYLHLDH